MSKHEIALQLTLKAMDRGLINYTSNVTEQAEAIAAMYNQILQEVASPVKSDPTDI